MPVPKKSTLSTCHFQTGQETNLSSASLHGDEYLQLQLHPEQLHKLTMAYMAHWQNIPEDHRKEGLQDKGRVLQWL